MSSSGAVGARGVLMIGVGTANDGASTSAVGTAPSADTKNDMAEWSLGIQAPY